MRAREDELAFMEGVRDGNAGAVTELLGRRRDLVSCVDDQGKTGLHWAAEKDHVEVARLLLDAGADVEARTSWGATPFDWAAVMGSVEVAGLLQQRGASGLTLVAAAALGKLDLVKAMSGSGADLSVHRRRGAPSSPSDEWPADTAHILGDVVSDALYAAARNGQAVVVDYLLDAGGQVDAKGFFGATGLHWAAINGHRDTVELLLDRGADAGVRDARFQGTPGEWAREGGHPDIAAVLETRTVDSRSDEDPDAAGD